MPPALRCRLAGAGLALLAAAACQRHPAADSSCLDPTKVNPQAICTAQYDPVCGCDGKTYANACVAGRAGVRSYAQGPCAGTKAAR